MTELARQSKAASRDLARLTTAEKNACLLAMAEALERSTDPIKEANSRDMTAGAQNRLSPALLDRLKLDDKRIAAMARGLREVAALPDPVGQVTRDITMASGLRVRRVRAPLGVIAMIAVYIALLRRGAMQLSKHIGRRRRHHDFFSRLRKSFSIQEALRKRIVAAAAKFDISTLPRSCHSKSGTDA